MLINLASFGYGHNYISLKVVELCALTNCRHNKSWITQLNTRTRRKVSEIVERCSLGMNEFLSFNMRKFQHFAT